LVPCVGSLPTGWKFARADAEDGAAQYRLHHDRAGKNALTVRLTRRCDTRGAAEVTSNDVRVRRFQQAHPGATRTWYDIFPGGCVTVTAHSATSRRDVTSQLAVDVPLVVGYTDRGTLRRALAERSGGRLHLDSAGS
jgi:hypothetical protein